MGKLRNLRNFMSITLLYYSYHVLNFKIINEYFFSSFSYLSVMKSYTCLILIYHEHNNRYTSNGSIPLTNLKSIC